MFRTERGRHLRRRRRGRRPRIATLLLLALLVAAAVVVGVAVTHDSTSTTDAVPGGPPSFVLGASDSATPLASEQPSASPSDSPPGVARGVAPLPAAYKAIPVAVYNTTDTTGLAAKVAARLKTVGWKVGTIASYKLPLTTTTVYYDQASKDAAFWMAANDKSVTRAAPHTSGVPKGAGLVVLVAPGAS